MTQRIALGLHPELNIIDISRGVTTFYERIENAVRYVEIPEQGTVEELDNQDEDKPMVYAYSAYDSDRHVSDRNSYVFGMRRWTAPASIYAVWKGVEQARWALLALQVQQSPWRRLCLSSVSWD